MSGGLIGVPHRLQTWPQMFGRLGVLRKPAGTRIAFSEGTAIAKQRNMLVQQMLDTGADWLLFIDDDHVFAPDALERLLAWNEDIVGGLYINRTPPYRTTARHHLDGNTWKSLTADEVGSHTLVGVGGIGMGFTLIRRRVFETLPAPWFTLGGLAADECSEDFTFCVRAREAGIPVYVDTSLRIGHLTVMAVLPDSMDPKQISFAVPEVAVQQAHQVRPRPRAALTEV